MKGTFPKEKKGLEEGLEEEVQEIKRKIKEIEEKKKGKGKGIEESYSIGDIYPAYLASLCKKNKK